MKTNKIIIAGLMMSMSLAVVAQTSFDAAKLYEEELNGTARYVGMGGAMGALGSDPSVISHNPAGIGTYHNSDVNMTVSFFGTTVENYPLHTKTNQGSENGRTYYTHPYKSDLNVALDNFSAIFCGAESGDNYLNFGISYRKLQNMDRNMDYVDAFDDADGFEVWREYKDNQRNKINSFDFNLSCNLSDMVYFGWTVGILSTDTWSEGYFYDYYGEGMHPDYPNGLDFTAVDKMNQGDGAGWNMAFGTIIRPIPALRLGVAVKTPTTFRQKLEYADYLYAVEGTQKDGSRFSNSVDYKYSSPWSLDLSAGLTFGFGDVNCALGGEYERHFTQRSSLSIGNTRMESQGAIDYKDYSVLKVGSELNIKNLSIRGGYNLKESMFNDSSFPYLYDSDFNGWGFDENGDKIVGRTDFQLDRPGKTQYFTGGIGYCSSPDSDGTQFYIDLAYVHGIRNNILNLKEYDEDIDVNYKYKTDKLMVTVGWNF